MKYFLCVQVCLKDKFPKVEWVGQSPLPFIVLTDIAKLLYILRAM